MSRAGVPLFGSLHNEDYRILGPALEPSINGKPAWKITEGKAFAPSEVQ